MVRWSCRRAFLFVIYSTWWHLPSKTPSKMNTKRELLHFRWEGHHFFEICPQNACRMPPQHQALQMALKWLSNIQGFSNWFAKKLCLGSRAGVIEIFSFKNSQAFMQEHIPINTFLLLYFTKKCCFIWLYMCFLSGLGLTYTAVWDYFWLLGIDIEGPISNHLPRYRGVPIVSQK